MNIFNHIPSLLPGQVGKWVLLPKTVGCAERLIDWLAACPPILCRPDEKKQIEKGPIKKMKMKNKRYRMILIQLLVRSSANPNQEGNFLPPFLPSGNSQLFTHSLKPQLKRTW